MIKYQLSCKVGHEFEAWFRSGDAYDKQAARHLIACPRCGSDAVDKRPMSPAVLKGRAKIKAGAQAEAGPQVGHREAVEALRALKHRALVDSEYVGRRFADEARKIHFGETAQRAIHGEATGEDAKALVDDGIPFGVLPILPEDHN